MFTPRATQWVFHRGASRFAVINRGASRFAIVGIACTAMLCASGAPALGAGKFTKKEDTVIAAQTELTKPNPKKRDAKTRPDITASDVFAGMGEDLKAVTDSQIKVLQKLIERHRETTIPEKPDLLFRMAELYAEQERYYSFKAREHGREGIFDAQLQKGNTADRSTGSRPSSRPTRSREKAVAARPRSRSTWRSPTVTKYQKLQQDGPGAVLPGLPADPGKEGRPGARVLQAPHQGLPPVALSCPTPTCPSASTSLRTSDLENALKFYDKVLQLHRQSRSTASPSTRRAGCTTT